MIDSTMRLLLEKYHPDDPRLTEIEVQKSTGKKIRVVMSANEFSEEAICKACTEFNRKYPENMSNSYQLPSELNGIPAGSWIALGDE